LPVILTRGLAVVVTIWLLSHTLYIGDEAYRWSFNIPFI
jgi:hypothetical protein